eukprot:CAMPEP_0197472902 /NCGR_PEP_ID=MMETSP1309-20131121/4204_1 /TAXON_ID=464262 /ORGANISM="Genus nov. species nov., Strain RCC998" /LENGTH=466 /DNA_ID=CAMNT_0043011759 /DNA_START=376 /DNA_END=1776 /DNA_ORIENTATION=-
MTDTVELIFSDLIAELSNSIDDGEVGKDAEGSKQVKASKGNEEEITSPKYDHKEAQAQKQNPDMRSNFLKKTAGGVSSKALSSPLDWMLNFSVDEEEISQTPAAKVENKKKTLTDTASVTEENPKVNAKKRIPFQSPTSESQRKRSKPEQIMEDAHTSISEEDQKQLQGEAKVVPDNSYDTSNQHANHETLLRETAANSKQAKVPCCHDSEKTNNAKIKKATPDGSGEFKLPAAPRMENDEMTEFRPKKSQESQFTSVANGKYSCNKTMDLPGKKERDPKDHRMDARQDVCAQSVPPVPSRREEKVQVPNTMPPPSAARREIVPLAMEVSQQKSIPKSKSAIPPCNDNLAEMLSDFKSQLREIKAASANIDAQNKHILKLKEHAEKVKESAESGIWHIAKLHTLLIMNRSKGFQRLSPLQHQCQVYSNHACLLMEKRLEKSLSETRGSLNMIDKQNQALRLTGHAT